MSEVAPRGPAQARPPLDTRPLVGPVLDVYPSWSLARRQIGERHPHALKIQGWPGSQRQTIELARREWPDVLLALCPGMDPIARRWRGHRDDDKATAEILGIADDAASLGIGHLCFDPEALWKGASTAERDQLAAIAARALVQIAAKHPALALSVTTYGWPVHVEGVGGHSAFPWRGWFPGAAVAYVGQTYDRGAGNLRNGERIALASYRAALAAGMMAPGTPRLLEVQTHHNDVGELIEVANTSPTTFLWAAGDARTFDDAGARAWHCLLALHRLGFWGRVKDYQAARGLVADGRVGLKTLAALDADVVALRLA